MSELTVTARLTDKSGDERLQGNVKPPVGTTTGFVLTAQADGTSAWQAGGGSGLSPQSITRKTLGADVTFGVAAGGTLILSQAVTMPATTGTYRVLGQWSMMVASSAGSNTDDVWIHDDQGGTPNFAPTSSARLRPLSSAAGAVADGRKTATRNRPL